MQEHIFSQSFIKVPESRDKLRKFINSLPKNPGVYKFLDESKNPIYIGKAKNLKNRVASYFRKPLENSKKLKSLIGNIKGIELTLTNTELEALLMEQKQIKDEKPKFNVQFKDDKGYPWIKLETSKEFPSANSFLGKRDKEDRFFGPFPSSNAVQESLKLIQKTFKIRNCSDSFFRNRTRPCIQHEIGRCSAPCVGNISKKEYSKEVYSAELLLSGKSEKLISNFYKIMDKHSKEKSFEKAAIYRDRISALRDIQRSQSIVGFQKNRHAIYLSSLRGSIKIGVSHVNQGWVTGHRNFILNEEFMEVNILERFILQKYISKDYCPSVLVIGQKLDNKTLIENALSEFHSKKISIISRPGKKDKGLLDLCRANTEYILKGDKIDKDIKSKIEVLGHKLKIEDKIKIIESYDISHHSGDNAVAGCVVYSDKGKLKELYRTYNISKENSGNDIGSLVELIKRRFSIEKRKEIPNLIIIDGGKAHLNSAVREFKELGIKKVNIISISKGVRRKNLFDSIHLVNGQTISIEQGSAFNHFIQEIRDETHRYAINSQKKRRSKSSIKSSIDGLSGVGERRKKLLLRYFGSLEQIKRASIDDLCGVAGIGRNTAQLIFNQIHY